MRKIFLLCGIFLSIISVQADDISYVFFPNLDLESITTENVGDLELLDTWGRGIILDSIWTPDGKYLRVVSTLGVWQYDVSDWDVEPKMLMKSPMYLDGAVRGWSVYRFSPNGETLFLTPEIVTEAHQPFDDTISFNIATGEILSRSYYDPYQIVSPDGTTVAYKLSDHYIHVGKFNHQLPYLNIPDAIPFRESVKYPKDEQPIA